MDDFSIYNTHNAFTNTNRTGKYHIGLNKRSHGASLHLNVFHFYKENNFLDYLGPVVQSIASLTSSLRGQLVKCFTTLYPKNTNIFC